MSVVRFDVLSRHNTTDRERILHALLCGISFNATLYEHQHRMFGYLRGGEDPQVGDYVIGGCGAVGELVKIEPKASQFDTVYHIRIAGTGTIQTWNNESFTSFSGISKEDLYEGDEWKFYNLARSVIYKDEREYEQRFNGLRFEEDNARIFFRQRWLGEFTREVVISNYRRFLKYKTGRPLLKELGLAGWGNKNFILPEKSAEGSGGTE